jgi:hypothetical protein
MSPLRHLYGIELTVQAHKKPGYITFLSFSEIDPSNGKKRNRRSNRAYNRALEVRVF